MDSNIWTKFDGDIRPAMECGSSNYVGRRMQSEISIKEEMCEPEATAPHIQMTIKQEFCDSESSESAPIEVEVDLNWVKQEYFDEAADQIDKPIIKSEDPLTVKEQGPPLKPIAASVPTRSQDPFREKTQQGPSLLTTSLAPPVTQILPIEMRKRTAELPKPITQIRPIETQQLTAPLTRPMTQILPIETQQLAAALARSITQILPMDAQKFTAALAGPTTQIRPSETRKLRAYTCDHCKVTIHGKTRLKKHIVQVHGTGTHKCEECNKVYKCKSYLRQHVQTVHKSDGQIHFCTLCQKVFKNRKNFYDHNYIAHTVIEYKCNICERVFKQKGNLEYHVATVHGNEHHECELCKKVFKAIHSLKQHIRNHHSSVQHECPICHRSFKQRQTLSHHRSTVHANGEHRCDICGKVFGSRIYLKSHIRTAHTNRGPDRQKFKCKVCFKEYKWKTSLRVHEKTSKCAKVKLDTDNAAANLGNTASVQQESFVTVKIEPEDDYVDC